MEMLMEGIKSTCKIGTVAVVLILMAAIVVKAIVFKLQERRSSSR